MKNVIKVVHFVSRLEFGGVEKVILNYVLNMDNRDNYEFHIVTQDINDELCVKQFQDNGFIVHVVTHKRKSIWKNIKEVCSIMKSEQFDIAHSHMTLTNFYIMILSYVYGIKKRISHSHNAFICNKLQNKVIWPVLKEVNKVFSNMWLACGEDAGTFLYGRKAVRDGKVTILRNAIDLDVYSYQEEVRKKLRSFYGIKDTEFCIGNIGRFTEQKNHVFLIELFEKFHEIYPSSKLLLVGSGELTNQIEKQVDKLELSSSVIFTGNVEKTYDFYQMMDVFLLPSLFEGLPLVLIEAQTSGLPCIISDTVDSKAIINNNVQSLPIDEGTKVWVDCLNRMVLNYNRLSDSIEIKKAGYSIKEEAKKLNCIYMKDLM